MLSFKKLGTFKTLIQCFVGCVISAVLVGMSDSKININVGGAFGLDDGSGKTRSSFGEARQSRDMKCEMTVVNPFEIIPETLPRNYLCGWRGSSNMEDALCFDPFDCISLHQLWAMYLVTGCIYLFSFFWYGCVWVAIRWKWVTGKNLAMILYGSIIFIMLSNFIFNKVLDKYLMGVFMDDFSEKIRSIISNNGYPGFRFRGAPVYELQGFKKVSQSLFDICSGMIVGLVMAAFDDIKNMTRRRSRRVHSVEMLDYLNR